MFPAWEIFNREATRLLTFKVMCNKMGSGKVWVWHVATCTLCTPCNVRGIFRTYEQLWRMVQACGTRRRTWGGLARRQERCSCSRLPAAAGGSGHRAQDPLQSLPAGRMKPGPAKPTQEPHRGHHWQHWEMICSKHAAAKTPAMFWPAQARMLRTGQRASFCLCINLSVPRLAYCKLFWTPHLRKDSLESGSIKRSPKVTKGMEQPRRD